ncbi:Uncharacterised protein [Mycobacteroides abscessus subsp. abscessus]|nr:Uncharacterised protein [Mycobacteroides abscessus subsp. abscessus]
MIPPETPLFAGIPILIANSPEALYMPQVTIKVLQIRAMSLGMISPPVRGSFPSSAKTRPILARFRQFISIAHCLVYKSSSRK